MIEYIQFPQDAGKKYESFRYPAGEVQVRLYPAVCDKLDTVSAVYIRATITNGEIVEFAQLISAIRGYTGKSLPITLFLPYLPYARADRRFTRGDCFGLSTFAVLLNSLELDKVVVLNAHSERSFLIKNLVNVNPALILDSVLEDLDNPLILLPDKGANRFLLSEELQCVKKRDAVTGILSGFQVPPREAFEGHQSVLIVDDICDGGGTFLGIAKELESYNLDLYLYVTHGIFSKGLTELNRHFKKIYTTDSLYPQSTENSIVLPCEGVMRAAVLSSQELWRAGEVM